MDEKHIKKAYPLALCRKTPLNKTRSKREINAESLQKTGKEEARKTKSRTETGASRYSEPADSQLSQPDESSNSGDIVLPIVP